MKRRNRTRPGRIEQLSTVRQDTTASKKATALRLAMLLLLLLPAMALAFEVDNEGDEADENPGDGNCAIAGSGLCTLRAAIQEANAQPAGAPYKITFADNVQTIVLDSALPQINVPIEINGQRSDAMNPRVELNGNQLSGGISFSPSASQDFDPSPLPDAPRAGVFNMVVHNFNDSGINLGGRGYTIQNNYIGVLPDGNTASRNLNHGISISAPAPVDPLPDFPDFGDLDLEDIEAVQAALIAALALANPPVTVNGNLISGNGQDGVHITGEHTALVFVRGNRIGTSADGDVAIPNGSDAQGSGVRIQTNSFANIVGPFNLISGNNRANSDANGIDVDAGAVRFPNFIAGNLIGPGDLDPFNFDPTAPGDDPFSDLGNVRNGIRVRTWRETSVPANPTPYSVIIGPANLIAFNGDGTPDLDLNNVTDGAGIFIDGSSEDGYVFGNVIGGLRFEVLGAPITIGGNKSDGIIITSPNQRIGGTSLAERNTISGNLRHGISLRGSGTRNVLIEGNLIGRDPLNVFNAGNAGDGIHINAASLNTIGGSADGAANVIAASGRNGIKVTNGGISQGWANLISRNAIFDNSASGDGIGIDLERSQNAPDPTTPLDLPNSWANQAQTAPTICTGQPGDPAPCGGADGPGFDSGSNQLALRAVLQSNPNRDHVIEVFLTDAPGNLGNGEGREFLESRNVSTDGSGFAVLDITASAPPGGAAGQLITLTATDVTETTRPDGSIGPANNSSEFSGAIAISTPGSVEFNPDSLNFGPVLVGSSADLTTSLRHVAGDAVTGISLGISGAGFSVQATDCPASPFSLAPGEDCEVTVRFAPGGSGSATGSLSATPASGSPAAVALAGSGQIGGSLVFGDPLLDFSDVIVGQSNPLTTTLSNPGETSVNNIQITISGAAFARDGGDCPMAAFNLAGGASCTVTVRFTPALSGPASGTLAATGNEDSTSIDLEGVGLTPAAITLDQPSYDFGIVTVGGFSERTAVLSNPGDVAATGLDVIVSGTGFSRVGGSCALLLDGGESCSLVIRFEPAMAGTPSGTLSVNADGGLSASAGLAGEAVEPGDLAFSPDLLAFSDVVVGQSATLSTDLENTGGSPINDIDLSLSGPGYSRDGGDCPVSPFSLAGGGSCSIIIRFEPAVPGVANGNLSASGGGATAAASLSGNGLAPASLSFNPASLPFGPVTLGQFSELSTTLSNGGAVSATGIVLDVSGAGFSRVGGDCPMVSFDLDGGDSCSLMLRFEPAAAGAMTGSLAASADGGLTASAELSGTGVAAGVLAFDPLSLSFGDVVLGQHSLLSTTLSNTGGSAVDGIALAVSGAGFSRDGGDCPLAAFSLAAGASCTVVIRFAPTAAGPATGSLGATPAGGSAATAGLSGSGTVETPIQFDPPGGLQFGQLEVGQSLTLPLLISNGSSQPLDALVIVLEGAFNLVGNNCPASLAAGANCTLQIEFAPASAGSYNGLVRVMAAGGIDVTTGLSGSAIDPGGPGVPAPAIPVPVLSPLGLLFLVLSVLLLAGRQRRVKAN